ncbi:MAG: AzlC family ABC transporter permease [Acidimicrobiales bacterium]
MDDSGSTVPAAMGDGAPEPGLSEFATLAFTFFAVGITVSVALVERGVDTAVIIVAAIVVYAATSELAFIAVADGGGSTAAGVLAGWLVASRFGILAVTLRARLPATGLERFAGALNALDPNVGLMIQQADPAAARRVFWRTTLTLLVGWITGSVVGVVLGNVLGDTTRWGFDVVFPAALLAIIGPLLRRRDGLAAGVIGALLCLVLLPVAPGGVPILVSALGAVAVVGRRMVGRRT